MSGQNGSSLSAPMRCVRGELTQPAAAGGRHAQMLYVIIPLLEIGLSEKAIFQQFRGMYAADVTDQEITNIIEWGEQRYQAPPSTGLKVVVQKPGAAFSLH